MDASNENGNTGADLYASLKEETRLRKLKLNGKLYERNFKLREDLLQLKQTNSEKKKWLRTVLLMNTKPLEVPVHEIKEVWDGIRSDVFKKNFNNHGIQKEQCLSVLYGPHYKTLDLVFDNQATRDTWLEGLSLLHKKVNQSDIRSGQELWINELFQAADTDGDGKLNAREVKQLMRRMNIETSEQLAFETFKTMSENKTQNDGWTMTDFIQFCKKLTNRHEMRSVFDKYDRGTEYLEPQELQDFLRTEQAMELSIDDCIQLILKYEPCLHLQERKVMSYYGFHAMMNGPGMDIFNYLHRFVYQDMTAPLAHYWIHSSHNTYLRKDQLKGQSATEAYIRVLISGCRCVELDCWDGEGGEPIIYHGYTMTSKILFKDVVECISQYAFKESEYPVILSVENHCSVPQQEKMVQYMRQFFGKRMLTDDFPANESLPSPEDLKGYIIVKGKKIESEAENKAMVEDEAGDDEDAETNKKTEDITLSKELSDLVTVCESVRFRGLDLERLKYKSTQLSSIAEPKAKKIVQKSGKDFIKHNQVLLSRIYPFGGRVDSSNYYPNLFWNVGSQIIALNCQTADEPMMLNRARFRDNGGCGYVKKPDFLLSPSTTFDPRLPAEAQPKEWKKLLLLKIISGYQLPMKLKDNKCMPDPYVHVKIQGIEADDQEQFTTHIENNAFNPVWNHEMAFSVSVPQLAIVCFLLWDHDKLGSDDLVGQYALPFESLKPGYRTVHLQTKHGDDIACASLFVHVSITQY